VLVAQLHGEKLWRLDPDREIKLGPGDLLYVPAGLPHEAVTGPTASLHLTIGVHAFTWADLVTEVMSQVPGLRAALPPGFPARPPSPAGLAGLTAELTAALRDDDLVRDAMVTLSGRLYRTGNAAVPGQFGAIDRLASLTERTGLRRAAGMHCRVRTVDGQATIEFAGNYVSGPPAIEPALRYIAAHEEFTAAGLPGELSRKDRLSLVDRLVSEGLLSVDPTTTPGGEAP
jgi:hypothetical protein